MRVTNGQVVVEDELIRGYFWIATRALVGVEGGNGLGIFYASCASRLFWTFIASVIAAARLGQKVELIGIRTSNLTEFIQWTFRSVIEVRSDR